MIEFTSHRSSWLFLFTLASEFFDSSASRDKLRSFVGGNDPYAPVVCCSDDAPVVCCSDEVLPEILEVSVAVKKAAVVSCTPQKLTID